MTFPFLSLQFYADVLDKYNEKESKSFTLGELDFRSTVLKLLFFSSFLTALFIFG